VIKVITPLPPAFAALPLREQVEAELRGWLAEGRYGAGEQLPTAREIARLCGDVNEQTVRRAMKRLIDEGLLRGAQGKGVFVSEAGAVKHHRVALVLPNLEDEMTRLIAKGARRVLDEAGFHTLILDARRDCEQESQHLATLPDLPVDGAIIFPVAHGDITERIVKLKMDGFPVVLVDKYCPGIEVDCVLADDFNGAYALTTALIQKGYRRIAWLSGEEGSTTVETRLDGYRWALGDHGLPVERALVRRLKVITPTSPYEEAVAVELEALLALENRPRALICANDLLAVDALSCLQRAGLSVPRDMAIAGFDDLQMARAMTPALTTVAKPIEEMGRKGADMLLARFSRRNLPPEKAILEAEIMLRRST